MRTSGPYQRKPHSSKRFFDLCCFLLAVLSIALISFYLTNDDFATEIKQVRQAKPNRFYIGIDVSQSVHPDALAAFNRALISRIRHFIGEEKVFYHISVFGIKGCGRDAIREVLSTHSPQDADSFQRKVERRISRISIAGRSSEDDEIPLTTPLFSFLEQILTERTGERVLIFSDLVNDEEGCGMQYRFPLKTLLTFGANKKSQITFLYPTPFVYHGNRALKKQLMEKQSEFIAKVQELSSKGKVRAFFYHVPDDQKRQDTFLSSHLKKALPSTMFEVVWARASRMFTTIIGARRG
jgi:hypothetical protein